jgi:hypothetical protein
MANEESRYSASKWAAKVPWLAELEAKREAEALEGRRLVGGIRKKFRIRADPQLNVRVRQLVHKLGNRYIVNDERLAGSPHLVFPARKLAIFTIVRMPDLFRGGSPNPSSRSPEEREAWELLAAQKAIVGRGWSCVFIAPEDARTKRGLERRVKVIMSETKRHRTLEPEG